MAEVSWRVGKAADRLRVLKSRTNKRFSGTEYKESEEAGLSVALFNGCMVCTKSRHKDVHARGDGCRCQVSLHDRVTRGRSGEYVTCKEDVRQNFLAERSCNGLVKTVSGIVLSNAEFSRLLSSSSNTDLLLWEVQCKYRKCAQKIQNVFGTESSSGHMWSLDCQKVSAFATCGNSETLDWHGNQKLSVTEAQNPNSVFSLPLDTSSQLHVHSRVVPYRKNYGFLTATINDKTNMTYHQQQRRFCIVLKRSEKQWHICVQPGFPQVLTFSRAYSWKDRNNSSKAPPLYRSRTAYYDILKVSPSATQAQIKTAYYKQSFIYHPDKNPGNEEATQRFSEISEAYTVLGSIALRRKYDRGILSQSDVQGAGRPSVKETQSASSSTAQQQKRPRHSHATGMGGKKVFDFDAFYQAHYGQQLQREQELRLRKEQLREKQQAEFDKWKKGKLTEFSVGLLFVLAVFVLTSLK